MSCLGVHVGSQHLVTHLVSHLVLTSPLGVSSGAVRDPDFRVLFGALFGVRFGSWQKVIFRWFY